MNEHSDRQGPISDDRDAHFVEVGSPYPDIILHLNRGKLGWGAEAFCADPAWDEALFSILANLCETLESDLVVRPRSGLDS